MVRKHLQMKHLGPRTQHVKSFLMLRIRTQRIKLEALFPLSLISGPGGGHLGLHLSGYLHV